MPPKRKNRKTTFTVDATKALEYIFNNLQEVPTEFLSSPEESKEKPGLELEHCETFEDLVTTWKEALNWSDGLDNALAVMLASVASTESIGDQLWIKIIAPASAGKSTLAEAVSVHKKYVMAKSTIRGFHSGFRESGDNDKQDTSLISRLHRKTLIIKDGDTLLQSPNLSQILSEGRDIYDGVSRTSYRNNISRDYEGIRMTWILCGTSSLRNLDNSELGERFLDCIIMDGIDDEAEDAILLKVAERVNSTLEQQSGEDTKSQQAREMTLAMQKTGGYIEYLKQNTSSLVSKVGMPIDSLKYCAMLGKFVAFMRARPSLQQNEVAEREFAARLTSQFVRLAKFLAVVTNRSEVNEEVLKRARKVCLDTSKGITLNIMENLFEYQSIGMDSTSVARLSKLEGAETTKLLRFLMKIKAVELYKKTKTSKKKWRLTPTVYALYEQVMK